MPAGDEKHSDRLKHLFGDDASRMGDMLEVQCPLTVEHQNRVAALSRLIAQQMGLTDTQVQTIYMAGCIHDVGMLRMHFSVFSEKPLDDLRAYRKHPQTGFDMLKTAGFPARITEIVLQHHERMDGSGWPGGLLSTDIHLEARIISVADVFDAIASIHHNHPARALEYAREEISDQGGILLDADAVSACLTVVRRPAFRLDILG